MALSIGKKAPDFTLKTKSGEDLKDVTLSNNFGKKQTVLLFIPFAFTGVCTKELCEVSSGINAYTKLDAEVYGISTDSPFAQAAWAKQENITIPLLSDFNKETAQAYDVLYKELLVFKGVAKRSAFVINKKGVITYSWFSDDPHDLPNFNEIKAALSEKAS
jgi:glutaredoxin-dependent peroxiredoxin